MRIIASASLLSVAYGSIQSSPNEGKAVVTELQLTEQVAAAYTPITNKGERFLGQECKPTTEIEPDVGILGCRNAKALCEEDEISSLGGRCALDRSQLTRKIEQPVFSHRQGPHLAQSRRETAPRFLQSSSWNCPSGCPKEFCKCAQKHGEVKHCANQMDDLCFEGLVSECVPYEYLPFYYQTYCPFSECIVANNAYHDCSCQYYRDYCTLYYAFNESTSKCNIAACCEAAGSADEKMECLPGLQPTVSPTIEPTTSMEPSAAPSLSAAPTISPKPTISHSPTASPTISHEPTLSHAPTYAPSASPSFPPTISFAPTTPSDNPSLSPTLSAAPTITSSPTNLDAPSSAPTVSFEPTESPTLHPTTSFSPSETPSIAAPTDRPTKKPSRRPTRLPTQKPTLPPAEQTPVPTEVSNGAGNGSVAKSAIISTLLGIVGAAWYML